MAASNPGKPRRDFPLFPAANGQWCRKFFLGGKRIPKYFGSCRDDPKGQRATADYLARKDAILAGLDSLAADTVQGGMTVVEMCKRVLAAKRGLLPLLSPDLLPVVLGPFGGGGRLGLSAMTRPPKE